VTLDRGQRKTSSGLPASFFRRPAVTVARELVGMSLVRLRGQAQVVSLVTETEAYEGTHDLASHSSRGRTKRTEVMFGAAGRFYIYRVYGLHWMLNIVTGNPGEAAAVLIRGLEGVSGPGRVAAALAIDASLNGRPVGRKAGLWFEIPHSKSKPRVTRTPRIGVDYAGPVWAAKKLRFVLS
jgi:DNA-3-methyladenine glycosylase